MALRVVLVSVIAMVNAPARAQEQPALVTGSDLIDPIDLSAVIPDQPGTRRIGLASGVELVIVSDSASPRSDVRMWLIVRAGSMHEQGAQRGAAMAVERIIRSGTGHFSADEIDRILGDPPEEPASGREKNQAGDGPHSAGSMVGFDQAIYMARVDQDDPEGFARAAALFGDVLDPGAMGIDQARLERAQAEMAERLAGEASAELRSRQRWLPRLMRGTLFGDRLPLPDEQEIAALTLDGVRRFARGRYRPERAMILVVGDVDPKAVEDRLGAALGSPGISDRSREGASQPGGPLDGRIRADVSMRTVLEHDPGFEKRQAAMVWFRDHGDESLGAWSVRAARYTQGDMRSALINRVAGEIVRHRLLRLGARALGTDLELGLDQFDLLGQVELAQIGVESSLGGWEEPIAFLARECDRLSRDGTGAEEIRMARGSVLARWHRDADDWAGRDNRDRIGLVHWLVSSGRPVIDMVRWDRLAAMLMPTIDDGEIEAAVRAMVDPRSAAYIALAPGERSDADMDTDAVEKVVEAALASPLDPIDPDWMQKLAGSLLDQTPGGGEIEEVLQHTPSGVWTARLGNGVRVLARSMDDPDGRVRLTATVWGPALGGADDRLVDAAMSAWRTPATESRGSAAVGAYLGEHDLRVEARREAGYIQLRVDGPAASASAAMELLYVLLDRPMIEQGVFDAWRGDERDRDIDPIDAALGSMFGGEKGGGERAITLDDAQRELTQIVRNGNIDIGIAGPIDTEGIIGEASELLGSLVERGADARADDASAASPAPAIRGVHAIRVGTARERDPGVVLGYIGGADHDLRRLRAQILAAMVLSDRIRGAGEAAGLEGRFRAQIGFSDVVRGRAVLFVRARCEEPAIGPAVELVNETMAQVMHEGIRRDELGAVKVRIDESIARYFGTGGYWSTRLSLLGVQEQRVDDLWTIREGYASIDESLASSALGELAASADRFTIEIAQEQAAP